MQTTLKVNTHLSEVHDIYPSFEPPKNIKKYVPDYIRPSNDSTYLKSIIGIVIDSASIYRIDESFYKLRYGDALDGIFVSKTNFDYDDLINNIISHKIKLTFLSIDLTYLKSFPKNIDKIRGLKKISVNFANKDIEYDAKLLNKTDIEYIKFKNKNNILNTDCLLKIKNLKTLEIFDTEEVLINDELKNEIKLTSLWIESSKLIGNSIENINKFDQLEILTIEDCQLCDGQLSFKYLDKLVFLNLRNNNYTSIPIEIFYLTNLKYITFTHNKIKSIPIDLIASLPKRETLLKIEIDIDSLSDKEINFLKLNKELLIDKGYHFWLYNNGIREIKIK